MSKIHIYGGGTFYHVRNHLSLCTPAFGTTAKRLKQLLLLESELHLTKMVDSSSNIITNDDMQNHISQILLDPFVKCIIMNAALCDYEGTIDGVESGKYANRLESREGDKIMNLTPSSKIISTIKKARPDIFVVGFKTTANEENNDVISYKAKRMGVDLVLANDVVLRKNIVFNNSTSESLYFDERDDALVALSDIVKQSIEDGSLIKNIKHSDNFITFWVEVKNSTSRVNAFSIACDILESYGITGEFINSKWSKYHQDVQKVSIRKENLDTMYPLDFINRLSK